MKIHYEAVHWFEARCDLGWGVERLESKQDHCWEGIQICKPGLTEEEAKYIAFELNQRPKMSREKAKNIANKLWLSVGEGVCGCCHEMKDLRENLYGPVARCKNCLQEARRNRVEIIEAIAKLVENHCCTLSCCDAQPSVEVVRELAKCIRSSPILRGKC